MANQEQSRLQFEEAFITEQTRLLQVSTPDAITQLKNLWLVRDSDGEYKELVAQMAWWAWQTASRTTLIVPQRN